MNFDWQSVSGAAALLLGGGGVAAVFGWRKPSAEANKIDAEAGRIRGEADKLVWEHMVETIVRLEDDVKKLIESRDAERAQIKQLQKNIAECSVREAALIKRISAIERSRQRERKRPRKATATAPKNSEKEDEI